MWVFSKEPCGKVYEDLIDLVANFSDEFILVRRYSDNLSENIDNLLRELSSFLLEIKEQQSWPGTELLNGYAKVFYYKFNEATKKILKSYTSSLYSWKHPFLLEDLCFFKEARKPWIITVAHESFGWIDCYTDYEIDKIKSIDGIELEKM